MTKIGLIVRHTPFEGIAGFREPVEAAGYVLDRIDVSCQSFADIDFEAPDLLLLMGGPMGVYETGAHPWIPCEIAAIRRRIEAGKPTLGVCLGSQLIAAALGASVYPGPVKEVGFASVDLTDVGAASPLRHLADVPVLHWHGDTFDLPEGVELLASTAAYPHQAFRRGDRLLALQCHPEMGEDERIEIWLAEGEDYVAQAGTDVPSLRRTYADLGPGAVKAGRALMEEWLAGLA
jgi:GMP synthase (glutamine-hydrolysing)